jgi:predicted RNA-binding protein
MCESKVVLLKNGRETVVMEDVVRIEIDGEKIKLYGILGESSEVEGKITLMDMKEHRIVVEG